MKNCQSYWFYLPIILCLSLGYVMGGYLSFGVKYLNALPYINDQTARLAIVLFGMGVLGGTTYSTKFWANDINEVVYDNKPKYLPHLFDIFGYVSLIVEGGITGIILYLIIRTGIGVATAGSKLPELTPASSLVIAYCGGLFHFRVINKLSNIAKKVLEEGSDKEDTKKEHEKKEKHHKTES